MNTFLKEMHSRTSRRNNLVKDSLQKQLNVSVMEVQGAPGASDGTPVGNCEETATLCSALEAVFLHGLKDSLLNRVTEALSGPDLEATPQPSFWGPLLVFSHRDIIDRVQSMTQISSEVGYCRAWIRLAMNEGLLSSYLSSIRRDNSALKPYYERAAFIRDPDLVDVTQRLVESLDYVNFELACNSSLLNFWSTTPLLMAAIWSPPMKTSPIFSAVDIAKTINSSDSQEEAETASSVGSLSSFNSSLSMLNNIGAVSDEEALRIAAGQDSSRLSTDCASPSVLVGRVYRLRKRREPEKRALSREEKSPAPLDNARTGGNDVETSTMNDAVEISGNETVTCDEGIGSETADTSEDEIAKNSVDLVITVETERQENDADAAPGAIGNSLAARPGWSTSLEDGESSMTTSIISRGSTAATIEPPRTPGGEGTTYDALIKSYHNAGYNAWPDLDEFLHDDNDHREQPAQPRTKSKTEVKVLDNLEDQIGKLPREKGLDVQNYSCFDCAHPIGMTFSRAHVCSFTGNYYCVACMSDAEYLIPSRVIHNWDLKHYPVCRRVAAYLTDCPTLLNLKTLNPRIYMAVDSMAQLQSLRIRLNLLRAYLFTCREPIIESLQKKVSPREYLYEHVHQYSVSDLLDVPSGALAQQLQKVVEFARQHVLGCWLCSQKGFICEVCNNPKVIYPFDMESTYRCHVCNAVFHADCLSSSKPCPKCERRRKRMDRPPPEVDNVEPFSNETTAATSTSAI